MNTSRRTLFAAAAGLPFAAQGMRSAQAQARWQFATPYQDTNFHTRNNRQFVEELEKATQSMEPLLGAVNRELKVVQGMHNIRNK